MANTIHALDFLASTESQPDKRPVCVLFGDESFLVQQVRKVLHRSWFGDDDLSMREFEGKDARWPDVNDELATISLFAPSGPRVAIVENADPFVQQNRSRLEAYVESPARSGILVLVVSSWPGNTRLFKLIDKSGLQIDCRQPKKSAKSSQVDLGRVAKWVVSWGKSGHGLKINKTAAQRIIDLIGPEFGLIDQNLAKLALYVEKGQTVEPDIVDEAVGGWRCQTIWEAIDAIMDGDSATGLRLIDRLIHAGENPLALFGQMSWSIRRYGVAARAFDRAEKDGQRIRLEQCIVKAGFREWNRTEIQNAARHLKRLGRKRALRIPQWLLETDLALKGSHSNPSRSRFAIEELCLKLAAQPLP